MRNALAYVALCNLHHINRHFRNGLLNSQQKARDDVQQLAEHLRTRFVIVYFKYTNLIFTLFALIRRLRVTGCFVSIALRTTLRMHACIYVDLDLNMFLI